MWTWNFKNTGHKPTAGAYQPSMSIKFQITYICEVGGSDSSAPIQHITSVEARKTLHAWFLSLQMRTKTFQCAEIPRKFLTSIFWDQDGILTDYLPKGQTINAEYYSSLLVQLKDILKEKRRQKVTKGVLFLHNNAPAPSGTCNPEEHGLPGLPMSS